jgi:hypothetical protein
MCYLPSTIQVDLKLKIGKMTEQLLIDLIELLDEKIESPYEWEDWGLYGEFHSEFLITLTNEESEAVEAARKLAMFADGYEYNNAVKLNLFKNGNNITLSLIFHLDYQKCKLFLRTLTMNEAFELVRSNPDSWSCCDNGYSFP